MIKKKREGTEVLSVRVKTFFANMLRKKAEKERRTVQGQLEVFLENGLVECPECHCLRNRCNCNNISR
jgi:hypothetical protein